MLISDPRSIQVPRRSTIPSRPLLRSRRTHRKYHFCPISVYRSRQVVPSRVSLELRHSLPYSNVLGVPTIRFAQTHGAHNLLNLSTIATFFSSVTATSLQFSFSDTSSGAANAVNAFWFTSLVFSIGEFVHWMPKVPSLITLSSCRCQQSAGVDLEAGHVVRPFVTALPLCLTLPFQPLSAPSCTLVGQHVDQVGVPSGWCLTSNHGPPSN